MAKLLLEAEPTWLGEKALVVDALKIFIIFHKPDFYGQLLDDTKCMAMLDGNDNIDKVQLRAYGREHRRRYQALLARSLHDRGERVARVGEERVDYLLLVEAVRPIIFHIPSVNGC